MTSKQAKQESLIDLYLRRLGTGDHPAVGDSAQGFEAASDRSRVDLSERGITDSVGAMRARMESFAERYYSGIEKDSSSEIITRVCDNTEKGLRLLQIRDEEGLKRNPEALSGLEQIISEDGSRPMYMVEDDRVDFLSDSQLWDRAGNSPWVESIGRAERKGLPRVMSSVGAITGGIGGNGFGTGFLVAPDLLMTNGHVWWKIKSDYGADYSQLVVDFQREYRRERSSSIRQIRSLAYVGMSSPDPEDQTKRLFIPDIALFVLGPDIVGGAQPFFEVLSGKWRTGSEPYVFVIGHPTIKPNNPFAEFLLPTSGCKRLSPGLARVSNPGSGQAYHDASTTDGSSGSVLVSPSANSPNVAVGIHYSFDVVPDAKLGQRETNFAQVLPHVLDTVSDAIEETEPGTLEQILTRYGAKLRPDSFPS